MGKGDKNRISNYQKFRKNYDIVFAEKKVNDDNYYALDRLSKILGISRDALAFERNSDEISKEDFLAYQKKNKKIFQNLIKRFLNIIEKFFWHI